MTDNSQNNKRIAKNTMFLYFRMLFLMFISFFTSRILLEKLGVEDYGIYNVVGSVVAIFSSVQSLLASSTQRFLNYEHGIGNTKKLSDIFSMSVLIHIILCAIFLVLILPIGLYIINSYLVIPESRSVAANWVFVFSILTVLVTIMTVPYNAVIMANERMNAFAYISIVDGLLKLLVIYLLVVSTQDHLIVYAVLLFASSLVVRIINIIYCRHNFHEAKDIRFIWDKELFKKMGSFAGWQFLGNTGWSIQSQGLSIIINMFFGPILNAARAISNQVDGALNLFVNNMMLAFNPQITKLYASRDEKSLMKIFYLSSRLSFLLFAVLAFPILLSTNFILELWLGSVPAHTASFVQCIFSYSLIRVFHNPIDSVIKATGKIKYYQLTDFLCLVAAIPVVVVVYKLYPIPEIMFLVMIFFQILATIIALALMKRYVGFSVVTYLKKVILPGFIVSGIMFLCYIYKEHLVGEMNYTLVYLSGYSCLFALFSGLVMLSKEELFKMKRYFIK